MVNIPKAPWKRMQRCCPDVISCVRLQTLLHACCYSVVGSCFAKFESGQATRKRSQQLPTVLGVVNCWPKLSRRKRRRERAYDLVKTINRVVCRVIWRATESGLEEPVRKFPFSSDSAYDLVKPNYRSRKPKRKDQSQCTFLRFVIGLVHPLLLGTPITYFSLDRKRRSRKLDNNAVFYGS